jgi:hypothetical protein
MRLLSVLAVLAVCFICWSGSAGSAGPKSAEQLDIGRSGTDFMEVCSSVDTERNTVPVRIRNDATCLGWIEGFRDGFTVHDELLSIPEKDRMVCMPRGVTTIQIVHAIKKYIADNPDKAHRATRYLASVALAHAFPCKAGK